MAAATAAAAEDAPSTAEQAAAAAAPAAAGRGVSGIGAFDLENLYADDVVNEPDELRQVRSMFNVQRHGTKEGAVGRRGVGG